MKSLSYVYKLIMSGYVVFQGVCTTKTRLLPPPIYRQQHPSPSCFCFGHIEWSSVIHVQSVDWTSNLEVFNNSIENVGLQKVCETRVINRNFFLKYDKSVFKILFFLDLKLDSRSQCPNRKKWPLCSNGFQNFPLNPLRSTIY